MNINMWTKYLLIFIFHSLIISFINLLPTHEVIPASETTYFVKQTQNTQLDCPSRSRGATWVDYDGDNRTDLFICNGHNQRNILYHNIGNGRFEDVTEINGLSDMLYSYYSIWVDIDNDGSLDLYVDNFQKDVIYHNQFPDKFEDITGKLNLQQGNRAVWADYDGDGWIDVYITRADDFHRHAESPPNLLYRNTGKMNFCELSHQAGVGGRDDSYSSNWIDYDLDGDLDLYVSNSNEQPNRFYRNEGNGTFEDISENLTIVDNDGNSFWADYDNDGLFDLFIAEGEKSRLYKNLDDGHFEDVTEIALTARFNCGSNDATWVDFDNDGYLDLYFRDSCDSSSQSEPVLYRNNADGTFADVANDIGLKPCEENHGFAWGDFEDDGDLDLYLLNRNRNILYRNEGNQNNHIDLVLTGNQSNRFGIGALVKVVTGDLVQTHAIGIGLDHSASLAQSLHFGLSDFRSIDSIIVRWPSGVVQDTANIAVNQKIRLCEPFPLLLSDATQQAGIQDDIDKSMAAAFIDVNMDQSADLFIANHEHASLLYLNDGTGLFKDMTNAYGIELSGYFSGIGCGDFNNDGFDDIFIARAVYSPNMLLLNVNGKRFKNISMAAGIALHSRVSEDVVLSDFNNDGNLDVYVANDGPNEMYFNNGDLTFTDVTLHSGTGDSLISRCTAADYDNDGDPDIYVANNRGGYDEYQIKDGWPNRLYRNNGDGTFTDVAESVGVRDTGNSKGCCFGDYDNDGHLDLYVGNDGESNRLYHNNGDGTFTDMTSEAGVSEPAGTHGAIFSDLNNDGWLDIYAAGGSYIPEQHAYCMKKDHPDMIHLNNGDGSFSSTSVASNIALTNSVACADIDHDGDMDIFTPNSLFRGAHASGNRLLQNNGNCNHWLHIKLIGTKSNRSAIGARVSIVTQELTQIREVNGGDGGGSQGSLVVEFGLGTERTIKQLTIRWPSNITQTLSDVDVNQLLTITEPVLLGPLLMSARSMKIIKIALFSLLLIALIAWGLYHFAIKWRNTNHRHKRKHSVSQARPRKATGPSTIKIHIDIIPFRDERLLSYAIEHKSDSCGHMNAFTGLKKSETPYPLKDLKLKRLTQETDQLWKCYSHYLKTNKPDATRCIDRLKKIGNQIYLYCGLTGLLEHLFSMESSEKQHLNLIMNDPVVSWQWAYDEARDHFLCNMFPVSITFSRLDEESINEKDERKLRGNQTYKSAPCAILFFGDWKGHSKELKKVREEIDVIGKMLERKKVRVNYVYQDIDQFMELVRKLNAKNENLRLIHYSGHIGENGLELAENEFLAFQLLHESYGLQLPSRPLVFLNGCRSGAFDQSRQKHDSLAMEVLRCGAAASVVTRFHIAELSAKNFAERFYHHFVNGKKSAGMAMRLTRLDLARAEFTNGMNPDYDISRYFYDLFGDVNTIFNPWIKLKN
jgi:hypothetical protein